MVRTRAVDRDLDVLVRRGPIETVPLDVLLPAESPRRVGEDGEHIRALAESEMSLPPILVHRNTMRIIDGMHRFRAALISGKDTIDVHYVDCREEEMFLLAVKENVAHGLPLSFTDREAAAARIVATHPSWSDRAIASIAGLGGKTVAAIRRRSTEHQPQSNDRLGQDGRVRPVNGAAGRRRASEIVAARPVASLREIARDAGVSVATAREVRLRMAQGQDPVTPKQRVAEETRRGRERINWPSIRQRLRQDPALRYSETGRALLRWLDAHALDADECKEFVGTVPPHWTGLVADYARQCATEWQRFANNLDHRRYAPE